MADGADALRILKNCEQDFRDARNHKGEYAFDQWQVIVRACNNALKKLWDDGWLRTIPGIQGSASGFPVGNAWLSHELIGFDDFDMDEIGSWHFMPGLIQQDPIFICNESEGEMADRDDLPSFAEMWDRHGFMILGRYASACELIVEIAEREMASKQSNEITETVDALSMNHGNLVTSVDIHAAISRLRHLSDEFKEARRIPANERMEVAKSIGVRASETLARCWTLGYLRSIPSLQKRFDDLRNQANSTPGFLGEIWFKMYFLSELVGYRNAVVQRVVDFEVDMNEEGEEVIYECSQEYLFLRSGILAKDRFLITPDILLGPVPMSDGEIATAASKHGFEVLGYYAQGCEVLAEIVEREVASKNDEREVVDSSRPEEASLPEAALKAIVDGGMAGVLNEAGKLPAAQRHSRTMMEMLAKDARYYWWSAEDWVVHLKSSKPTILETDAWDHIKRWREENKRERLAE